MATSSNDVSTVIFTISGQGRSRGSENLITCDNYNNNRGGRRPPHCQLCRTQGHYAGSCPNLASYAAAATPFDDSMGQVFHAPYHVSTMSPNWYVDSGASDHMTNSSDSIFNLKPPTSNQSVLFGDGKYLPVSHKGDTNLLGCIKLSNVLVVPKLTKYLLSVSKLTEENDLDICTLLTPLLLHPRSSEQTYSSQGLW